VEHIAVCICTYRRPEWLRRLLVSLQEQRTDGRFTYSIVVTDNDATGSARTIVEEFARSRAPATYCLEPVKNIAMVRNRAIEAATGNWIAFIDDDEFPISQWLHLLHQACTTHQAEGVLGPVRPHFDEEPPRWVRKCGLYDRPEHPTGYPLPWRECRTGNVLFRRDLLPADEAAFDARFDNGGEDQDFFRRLMERGARFIWCNEAVAYETVPPIRWNKKVMMQRALLRGKNTLKHADITLAGFLKSTVAVVAYGLALPILAVAGMHFFMRYLVKLCDHLGKLLAAFRINPVRNRLG
jgi:glycosyltransferase involved in cell wall biosynthesis